MPRNTAQLRELSAQAKAGFIWLASTTLLWQVVAWLITIFTARILTPVDYGILAMAETLMPYLGHLVALRLSDWIVHTETLSENDKCSVLSLSVIMSVLVASLAYVLAPFLASFYSTPDVETAFRVLAFALFLNGIQTVPRAYLEREFRFKTIGTMTMCVGLSRGLLQLGLAYAGAGFWALVIGILYRDLMRTIWLYLAYGRLGSFGFDLGLIRRIIAYGVPATGAALARLIFTTADDVVVGRLFGGGVLGIYSMAFFLTDLPMSKLNSALNPVLVSYLSRLKSDSAELHRVFLKIVRTIAYLLHPALIGLAIIADELIPLLLGEKWVLLVTPLQILCLVGVLRQMIDYISPFLLSIGEPQRLFAVNLTSALIMPPAFFILGKQFGIQGVYIAWLMLFPLVVYLSIAALRSVSGISIREYLANLQGPLLLTMAMSAILLFARGLIPEGLPAVASIVLQIAFGSLLYGGLFITFKKEDAVFALSLIRKKNVEP